MEGEDEGVVEEEEEEEGTAGGEDGGVCIMDSRRENTAWRSWSSCRTVRRVLDTFARTRPSIFCSKESSTHKGKHVP
mgnify:CR=1 FL=1